MRRYTVRRSSALYVCMYICMYVYMCMHVYVYVCMYVHVCVCMHVYVYVCISVGVITAQCGRKAKNPGVGAPLVSASCRYKFWYQSHSDYNKSSRNSDWTMANHQEKQLSNQSQKGKKSYVSIRVQRKTNG